MVEALSSSDGMDAVLDLTDLSFVDSSGLSYLVKAKHALGQQGKEVRVVVAGGSVMRAIELTGLTDVLHVVQPTRRDGGVIRIVGGAADS
jgi:anti-anti-sigma factor